MRDARRWLAILAFALGLACWLYPGAANACLWDNDTLVMERSRFPQTWEVISGRFPRHSPAFYAWRIRDRTPKIDGTAKTLPLIDDVAVAYDKQGQHDTAVFLMVVAAQLQPGRYETAANMGTFLFHRGDLEAGLPFIEQALAINPDAHFGRERYQQLLVEYVLARREAGRVGLPLREVKLQHGVPPQPGGFAGFLKDRGHDAGPAAVKGVLGMLRFGHHDSPVLLEALGDLLLAPHQRDAWKQTALSNAIANQAKDAKRLAVRAYLRAASSAPNESARSGYRLLAEASLQSQSAGNIGAGQESLATIAAELQREIEAADAFVAGIAKDEARWIEQGVDVEARFAQKYLTPDWR